MPRRHRVGVPPQQAVFLASARHSSGGRRAGRAWLLPRFPRQQAASLAPATRRQGGWRLRRRWALATPPSATTRGLAKVGAKRGPGARAPSVAELAEPSPLAATSGRACGAGVASGAAAASPGSCCPTRASERLAYSFTHFGRSSLPAVARSSICRATASMPAGGCLKHAVTVDCLPGAVFMR